MRSHPGIYKIYSVRVHSTFCIIPCTVCSQLKGDNPEDVIKALAAQDQISFVKVIRWDGTIKSQIKKNKNEWITTSPRNAGKIQKDKDRLKNSVREAQAQPYKIHIEAEKSVFVG